MSGRRICFTALLLFCLFQAPLLQLAPAQAQSVTSGGRISEIRVEGTQRIEPETVRSYLRLNPGDAFDPIRIDQSLKSIFATGLFADVTLRRERDALIVTVVENPIINRVAFEGNDRIDDETLENETELRSRIVFTRTKVQNDVQRILELYRRSGRFAATVEPKVIELAQNRVDLVFEINEGPVTGIQSINFVGNRAFSDGRLREELSTSETSFWNFLSSSDTYDPDRLTFDRELLRRFYLSEGYADFRVVSVVAELTPGREGFIVTFTVDEGERYRFGSVEIQTSLRNLDPESLREQLATEDGDVYDASAVEKSINNLTEEVGKLGFAFVDIQPRAERDRESLIIDLVYDIKEGPKVFVERIDIRGNVRTLDKVVRREFRLVEGDAFNSAKLRRSRQRIQNLGFFSSVDVNNEPGSEPDRTVVAVDVEEQSTGDLTFGAGFSSNAGPLGNISLRERNLLGRGQDLRLGFTLSGERSQLDLSFTEPYFLDRNLAAGFDAFRVVQEQDESSFDENRLGGGLRAGYNYTENVRQVWRYIVARRKIDDVDDSASLVIQDEEGTRTESSIAQEISYDTRDSRFDPREGAIATLSTQFAGVGGNVKFLKTTVGAGYYFPLADDLTLSFNGEVGRIDGIGEDTRASDRFFLGGTSFRGFEFAGIGPRDANTDDALGGKNFYTATTEFSFPIGLPSDIEIRGRVFSIVGSVWDLDNNTTAVIDDENTPRISVGTGITWNSPFGPVLIDLALPVIKEDFDESELLSFSFGTRF
ncbi:MAG: outer membrane protein assembly factor BamA [Kiloniellales bacterium]|nr:outer membrane protein assembly factor BamA [Kiloniellales bacterium]